MRLLLRFAARLYPRAWRERYGAEFEALLDDAHPRWTDLFDVFKETVFMHFRYSSVAGMAALFGVIGVAIALSASFAMPRQWKSEVHFNVSARNQDQTRDAVAGLSQAALNKTYLEDAITKFDLYPIERKSQRMSAVIQKMERSFTIIRDDSNKFRITFAYEDPKLAQRVVNWAAVSLIEANLHFSESRGSKGLEARFSQIRLEHPATFPERPTSPNWLAITAFGLSSGLVVGVGMALLRRKLTRA
jgi:LPS O-antigen subunit length determinant protein (WzzB/FepE family)